MSRGVNGKLVIAAPHILQVQFPATFGLSPPVLFASDAAASPPVAAARALA